MVKIEKKRIGRVEVVLRHGGIRKEESTRSKCWFDVVESQKKRIDPVEVLV
ncbi:hypothetical protein [Bacillus sp. SG-1]|uniref:hypothetical protein n=1 Tax=Bacillus sp. SG-1 TaxID=161544 RepID=UPI000154469F|nr:hypothetical protein [Bacillus sp. SG-1]EDL63639.1 hypothetical protein BSG1_10508 [Bacillus sp. SG-1]